MLADKQGSGGGGVEITRSAFFPVYIYICLCMCVCVCLCVDVWM